MGSLFVKGFCTVPIIFVVNIESPNSKCKGVARVQYGSYDVRCNQRFVI